MPAILIAVETPRRQRPYVIPQPGCVPPNILREFTGKLVELLLFGNPPDTSAILSKSSMAQVDDGLFLGSFLHADNTNELVRQKVTHVLNCAKPCCPNHTSAYYAPHQIAVEALDATDCADYPILENHFDAAYDFLEGAKASSNKARCLIHCYQGLNRSATLCVAYLVVTKRMPLMNILSRVHAARPGILGNVSFRRQLIEFAYANGLLMRGQPMPIPRSPLSPPTKVAKGDPFPDSAVVVSGVPVASPISFPKPTKPISIDLDADKVKPDTPTNCASSLRRWSVHRVASSLSRRLNAVK
eukprot:EG_transcript_12274